MNALGCLALLMILNACSEPVKDIEISTRPVDKPSLVLPPAGEVNLRDINWFVITPENFDEKVDVLRKSGQPVVFFALSGDGYESLSLNVNDLRTHVEELNAIIAVYEVYYTQADSKMNSAVIIN